MKVWANRSASEDATRNPCSPVKRLSLKRTRLAAVKRTHTPLSTAALKCESTSSAGGASTVKGDPAICSKTRLMHSVQVC